MECMARPHRIRKPPAHLLRILPEDPDWLMALKDLVALHGIRGTARLFSRNACATVSQTSVWAWLGGRWKPNEVHRTLILLTQSEGRAKVET